MWGRQRVSPRNPGISVVLDINLSLQWDTDDRHETDEKAAGVAALSTTKDTSMNASCLSAKLPLAARLRSPARGRMLVALLLGLYGALGAGPAQAAGGPYVESVYQNGNNVIVSYFIPDNTPGFSHVQTRWNGPGTNTTNEHQQKFKLGFGSRFKYTIPNIQSYQGYVFKVQGYAGTWSTWNERRFNTRGVTYRGFLYQRN